ncbi:DUF2252 domain-containing protein [Massilia glaciei]|uniref:DUF2252 domain-containing protein n=1 Tax=Massilia glaciei TaxID=1524097 RepID=A0A2U2HM88_9BURK|nr:DUF2252 family protein [Massilia glaciei]PWF48634.1 DUF2252 domain-containing protein [Massilia glaciei]
MHKIQERNVAGLVAAFNADREPERVGLKYKALAKDPFTFLRGTCHLFYQDFPDSMKQGQAPLAWICGDLHLENFGSYKGDNRLTYFDINDFGEAVLAPANWELSRFLVSVLVAAESLGLGPELPTDLCNCFLDAYVAALAKGKPRWVERPVARGMVKELLQSVKTRGRVGFLNERSKLVDGKRTLRLDPAKALPVTKAEREKVAAFMATYAQRQQDPAFFKVLDVARRIAGTGSLGLERYVILVRGRGAPEGHFLLDLKYTPESALAPYLPHQQPAWGSQAQRVVAIGQRVQAIEPAFLEAVSIGTRSYVLQELLPSQDRLALDTWDGKPQRLEGVMRSMGEILAWGQLRAGGREGAADADAWIAHAADAASWRPPLLAYAHSYRDQVIADWKQYRTAFQAAHKARARQTPKKNPKR